MRTTSITTVVVVAVAALALTACGDDDNGEVSTTDGPTDDTGAGGGDGDVTYPTGADELVVQVANVNVTTAPGSQVGNVPFFSLYGDGRVISVGPTTLEFPGAALPNLVEGTISADDVEAIVAEADAAGLLGDDEPDLGEPGLSGGTTTVITVNAGGAEHTINAYALDADDSAGELTDEQAQARARVRDFVRSLDGDVADAPYEADAVGVFIQAPFGSDDDVEEVDWPLGDLADTGEPIESTSDIRCVVYTGDDAQTVLGAAADARENAIWRSAGAPYSLTFRPLLPNEETCADLEGAGAR